MPQSAQVLISGYPSIVDSVGVVTSLSITHPQLLAACNNWHSLAACVMRVAPVCKAGHLPTINSRSTLHYIHSATIQQHSTTLHMHQA